MDEELLKLLNIRSKIGPTYHSQDLFTVKVRCEFEPFGLASENWDEVWVVVLNTVPAHWMDANGIHHKCTTDFPMQFKGHSYHEAVNTAKAWLKDFISKGGTV